MASDQGFGASTPGLWANLDPIGYSLRTSVLCELEGLTGCVLTWRAKGTPSGRFWWVLGLSEPRTSGSESGSWPTATSMDSIGSGSAGYGKISGKGNPRSEGTTLTDAANGLWASPMAHEARLGYQGRKDPTKKGTQKSLTTQAVDRSFPSPKASDGRSKGTGGTPDHGLDAMARAGLLDQGSHSGIGKSRDWSSPTHADSTSTYQSDKALGQGWKPRLNEEVRGQRQMGRGVLNSRWVAQLMGYPSDWCDLPVGTIESLSKRSATQSCLKSSMPSVRRSSRQTAR